MRLSQIAENDFVETVQDALLVSGLAPERLEIEMTEASVIDDQENGLLFTADDADSLVAAVHRVRADDALATTEGYAMPGVDLKLVTIEGGPAGVGEEGIPGPWLDGLCEWPRSTRWMQRLAQQGHLEAVVIRWIVTSRDHDTRTIANFVGREIQHTRRYSTDIDDVTAGRGDPHRFPGGRSGDRHGKAPGRLSARWYFFHSPGSSL